MPTHSHAINFYEYGPPDVLQYEKIQSPGLKSNSLLIQMKGAGVNPVDWRYRKGELKWYDWFSSFPRTPGADIAGQVIDTGSNVEQFEPGDRIFAMLSPLGSGTYAEYVPVPSTQAAMIPDNITMVEAAGMPLVSLTSLQALRDHANLSEGEHVLINGASGGVGTIAVQMAKAYRATVTGVCSYRNLEMVKSLGADEVIDYTERNFAENTGTYDVVYDAYGNRSLQKVRNCLKPDGRYVTTDIRPIHWKDVLVSQFKPGPTAHVVVVDPNGDDLRNISRLVSDGKIEPVVDRTYSLEEAENAHCYSESHRATGKIILTPCP